MNLDEGVRDIKTAATTLEYIASTVPQKESIFVGLKNCETKLSYEIDVQRPVDLTVPK